MYQESEIVDLILVAFLTPMLWFGMRSLRIAGKKRFVAAYAAMVCAYVFTVAEGYIAADLMNLLEHISYAMSGILLALAINAFRRDALQRVRTA